MNNQSEEDCKHIWAFHGDQFSANLKCYRKTYICLECGEKTTVPVIVVGKEEDD